MITEISFFFLILALHRVAQLQDFYSAGVMIFCWVEPLKMLPRIRFTMLSFHHWLKWYAKTNCLIVSFCCHVFFFRCVTPFFFPRFNFFLDLRDLRVVILQWTDCQLWLHRAYKWGQQGDYNKVLVYALVLNIFKLDINRLKFVCSISVKSNCDAWNCSLKHRASAAPWNIYSFTIS